MPLHPAYAQVSALLAAVFILIAGNGLSNTLIPLSATAAHVSAAVDRPDRVGVFRRHAGRLHRGAAHHRARRTYPGLRGLRRGRHGDDAAAPDLRRSRRLGCDPRRHRLLLRRPLRHDRKLDARQGRERGARPRAGDLPDRPLRRQRDRAAGDPLHQPVLVRAVLDRRDARSRSRCCRSPIRAPTRPSRRRCRGCGSPGCSGSRRSASSARSSRGSPTARSGRSRRCSPSAAGSARAALRAS